MSEFHLITWREFNSRKLVTKGEIFETDNIEKSMRELKLLNSEKQLTTTDYNSYNLSNLAEDKGLLITKETNSKIWGWKSALTHHALDLIMPLVKNPYFVIVFRDIETNAKSWKLHKKLTYNDDVTLEFAIKKVQQDLKLLKEKIKLYSNNLF